MKRLRDILYRADIQEVSGNTNIAVEHICFDSREVGQYSAFVAIRGSQTDGHNFIAQAISQGAIAVIVEEFPPEVPESITMVRVKNTHRALAIMADNFYDHPSGELNMVGITGTNGKTSTVTMLFELFKNMEYKCGMISTVVNRIHNTDIPSTHTTPDPISLNKLLRQMVDEECTHCFMEVSSHALVQHRVTGVEFKVAIFSNISHDHLDYHETFQNYLDAKKMLFDHLPSSSFALVNNDDFHAEFMTQNCKGNIQRYALKTSAEFKAKVIENQFSGLHLQIDGQDVWTKIIGRFNAYNILSVYATAILLDEEKMEVLTNISRLSTVAGRFQYMKTEEDVTGVVDYAHTPDALKNVLETIRDIRTGNEQVITVVGCGGDRDTTKRPEMAAIACQLSDKVVLTSDNPRTEDPDSIIKDMEKGIDAAHQQKVLSITDRRQAIRTASALAQPKDIILVAGKGHENYQILGTEKVHFDDMEELTNALKKHT